MIPAGRKRRPIVQVAGLGARSLFLSFVLSSAFHSVVHPLLAYQLLGLGWKVSPFALIHFFFALLSLVLSFLSLFLALLRADHAVAGLGVCLININI